MNERMRRLINDILTEDLNPSPVTVEYDPLELKPAEPMMIARRIFEYLQAQPVKLPPELFVRVYGHTRHTPPADGKYAESHLVT